APRGRGTPPEYKVCHETIARSQDGPAADDDAPAATGHSLTATFHLGSATGNPGSPRVEPHAGTSGGGRGFRQRRPARRGRGVDRDRRPRGGQLPGSP